MDIYQVTDKVYYTVMGDMNTDDELLKIKTRLSIFHHVPCTGDPQSPGKLLTNVSIPFTAASFCFPHSLFRRQCKAQRCLLTSEEREKEEIFPRTNTFVFLIQEGRSMNVRHKAYCLERGEV
jgi:hypothetical protein